MIEKSEKVVTIILSLPPALILTVLSHPAVGQGHRPRSYFHRRQDPRRT